MIANNFKYYKPDTIEEAIEAYFLEDRANKRPIFYAGGTEVVTFARKNTIEFDAVIDIKGIRECNTFHEDEENYFFGSGLSLNDIIEGNYFPLLSSVSRPIADHTVRNKLTLGGNICGRLPYREAVLPLLLSGAEVIIAGEEGISRVSINDVFDKRLKLQKGQLLIQIAVNKKYASLPYVNIRREKQVKVDYPVLHIVLVKEEGETRAAFSGVCAYPFMSEEINKIINQRVTIDEKVKWIIEALPSAIKEDLLASKEYRGFLFQNTLKRALIDMEAV